jgi:hypothetical protein
VQGLRAAETAAIASMVVRMMLLYGSCSVRLAPEVCEWVRSISERTSLGAKCFCMSFAQSMRAARILAISMKKFMPIAQKNESRGAKSSIASPRDSAARTYSSPSASVNASSCTCVAPASCMW